MPIIGVRYRCLDFLGMPEYRVGDDGTVWTCKVGRGTRRADVGWKKMSPVKSTHGYLSIGLRKDNKYVVWNIGALVLTAFVGPRPEKMDVCHFPDDTKTNNSLRNLRWDTHKNNEADKVIHGSDQRGEKGSNAILTNEKVLEIRRLRKQGWRMQKLADTFGVHIMTISDLVRFRTWKYI